MNPNFASMVYCGLKIPTTYGRTRSSLLTVGVTTPSSVVTLCAHIWRGFRRLATTTLAKSGLKHLVVVFLCIVATACTTQTSWRQVADFGTQMARQGLWREAEFRWNQALVQDPTNARLLNNLAVAAEIRGDYDRAARLYRKALALDPDNRVIRKNYDHFKTFLNTQHSAD